MTLFDEWLAKTEELQNTVYNADPRSLEGKDLGDYITWNMLAAFVELGEACQEVQLKNWADGYGSFKDRDAFVGEVIDVLHFLANCLVAAKSSDDELSNEYGLKMAINRIRQEDKYKSGVKSYREIFVRANGLGPYTCFVCEKPVQLDELLVHHDDRDRTNNDPSNLKAAHRSCHMSHHRNVDGIGKETTWGSEPKPFVVESNKRRAGEQRPPCSDSRKQKISESLTGKKMPWVGESNRRRAKNNVVDSTE